MAAVEWVKTVDMVSRLCFLHFYYSLLIKLLSNFKLGYFLFLYHFFLKYAQNWALGLDGKESDSEDIPITKDYKKLIAAGYKYKKIAGVGRTDQVVTDKYIFIGGLADRATDGGHGGCGGTGGQPGRVHMIGFQDSSKFVVHNAAGIVYMFFMCV